jgi:hypothetical protein
MMVEQIITDVLNAVLLLMLWSVYYRENILSHFVESVLIGLAMGYAIYVTINTLSSVWVTPMAQGNWSLIIPAFLGFMLYASISRKYAYLSRISVAAIVGSGLGFAVGRTIPIMILGQISGLGTSLVGAQPLDVLNWAVVLVATVTTLIYFTFTREHKGVLGATSRVGRWAIMIGFGTIFGATIWGNHVFVIDRLSFLAQPPLYWFIPISLVVILIDILYRRSKPKTT